MNAAAPRDDDLNAPPLGCGCPQPARRRFGMALGAAAVMAGAPSWAAGDPECRRSSLAELGSPGQMEQAAGQAYRQMLQQASQQRALAPVDHPQVVRLRYIASRITPLAGSCNARAQQWHWEVNLIGSSELNAFCMPGGKIAFFLGILKALQLDDDEVAVVMGHEVSHALLEHGRERQNKNALTGLGIDALSAALGLGNLGRAAMGLGGQVLTRSFSREDESEADALGLVLSSRAGYRPGAGISLWQKMGAASKGSPPKWLSTHPPGEQRIRRLTDLQARAESLYAAAAKPERRFGPLRSS